MSIDARVSGLGKEGDEWFITLEDRPPSKPGENAGCAGQKRLRFKGDPPPWIVRLIGCDIWGGAGFLMYKEQEIATRKGYTRIEWTATSLHGLGPSKVPPPPEKPPPSYAAVYAAALYPEFVALFREHGYALAVHGSLRRDFDLVAVPWVKDVTEPAALVAELERGFTVRQVGDIGCKEHGRIAYTLSVGHGACAVDLSFMPVAGTHPAEKPVELEPAMTDINDILKNIQAHAKFGQPKEFEACCNCGEEYPRADLMAGHVYCSVCRTTVGRMLGVAKRPVPQVKKCRSCDRGHYVPWGHVFCWECRGATPDKKRDDNEPVSG